VNSRWESDALVGEARKKEGREMRKEDDLYTVYLLWALWRLMG